MITVRYFGAARKAAKTAEEPIAAGSLGDVMLALTQRHGPKLQKLLISSVFVLNGSEQFTDLNAPLPNDCTLDVHPPVNGG